MRFICSMEILTLFLEIVHEKLIFLAGSWSIFILGDCCSAEGRDSPAGCCSLFLWSQGSPAKPWHVPDPGCAPTHPCHSPRGSVGPGVHSGSFSVGDFYFPPSQTTLAINQDSNAFTWNDCGFQPKKNPNQTVTKIHTKKKLSSKPYCIDMDAI